MRWLIMIFAVIFCFYGCAKKQAVQPSEGVEEISVLEEEELVEVSEEEPVIEEVAEEEEEVLLPPEEEEEEVILPPPEEVTAPPTVEEEVAELPPPTVEETPAPTPTPTPTPEVTKPRMVLGFRVQIFASSTNKGARKVASDARAAFNQQVYVEHDAPYYKVRVGDCLSKDQAKVLKSKAINLGYRGAFVVETKVNLK